MTDFNPDADIEPEEEIAEDAPEQSSNRVFILVALGLAGLFVIGLICIGLFAFVVLPGQRVSRDATAAAIIAANTQIVIDAEGTANPATNTLEPSPTPLEEIVPTDTEAVVLPTNTPVIAIIADTATSAPSNTAGPSATPSRTPTRVGGSVGTAVAAVTGSATVVGSGGGAGATATPTRIGGGGTAAAAGTVTATVAGGTSLTRTPTPTALPDTGFADEVGGPGLLILAIALVAVFFFARQMRMRNAA